jgi:hypothetical protein
MGSNHSTKIGDYPQFSIALRSRIQPEDEYNQSRDPSSGAIHIWSLGMELGITTTHTVFETREGFQPESHAYFWSMSTNDLILNDEPIIFLKAEDIS